MDLKIIIRTLMKKTLIVSIIAAMAFVLSTTAAETQKKHADGGKKAMKQQMLEKYDTNKDGKLDKEERAKMTAEDRKALKGSTSGKKSEKSEKSE